MKIKYSWLVVIFCMFSLLFMILWIGLRSDTLPESKASLMEIMQTLGTASEAANKCWRGQHLPIVACQAMKVHIPTSVSSDFTYLASDQGVLIGVNYPNQITIALIPEFVHGELQWHCIGSPQEIVKDLCHK